MTSHMNGQEEEINQRKSEIGFESNSQSSMSSLSQQHIQQNTTEDVKPSISLLKQPSLLKQSLQGRPNQQQEQQQLQQQSLVLKEEKSHETSDSDDDSSDSDGEQSNSNEIGDSQNYACDLCDSDFKSATELRQHVKSHIESFGGVSSEESNDDNEYYEGLYSNSSNLFVSNNQ